MVEKKLVKETEKWSQKLQNNLKHSTAQNEKGKEFIKNIKAYLNDSQYFMENNQLIEAFEAVIWAWAYLEIGKDIGNIKN